MATTAIERQKEVAGVALEAERVSERMLARLADHRGPTIIVSRDEYVEIGMTMMNVSGIAKELHALLASGPSRAELLALSAHTADAATSLGKAMASVSAVVQRVVAPIPTQNEPENPRP